MVMLLTVDLAVGQTAPGFEDVPSGHVAETAINWAAANGVTVGVGNNRFGMGQTLTRYQMVTFLCRAFEPGACRAGDKGSDRFADVPADHWANLSIGWAVDKGITSGFSTTEFGGARTLTREQTVTLLYRAKGSPPGVPAGSDAFTDVPEGRSHWANLPIGWAYHQGVIGGTAARTFGYGTPISREETVLSLCRAVAPDICPPSQGPFAVVYSEPPFSGTAKFDPDIILPSDPTDFVELEPAGRGDRFVYDRRGDRWITIHAFLFDATFANGLSAEFQVNPEFGTWAEAEAAARAYAPAIGQIPSALREDMDAVWIHRGEDPLGGGNRALLVHTDRAERYRERGILPEVFIHEGVHMSLDAAHKDSPGWRAAQAADPTFISTYARDHPGREDLAESFSAWLAVRHRRDRITEEMAYTISSAIPHRLAYFDSLPLNLCPLVIDRDCEPQPATP